MSSVAVAQDLFNVVELNTRLGGRRVSRASIQTTYGNIKPITYSSWVGVGILAGAALEDSEEMDTILVAGQQKPNSMKPNTWSPVHAIACMHLFNLILIPQPDLPLVDLLISGLELNVGLY